MASFTLKDLLRSSARQMRAGLAERLVAHPGELGAGRETIVRELLSRYLPRRFEVSTGFAFDAKGRVSEQLDIVIADTLVCPRLETTGGTRFHPCESIVAVGQVRSQLTSRTELSACLTNLESAKRLDRSAGGVALDFRNGEQIDQHADWLHQIFTFLLVTGPSLAGETTQSTVLDYAHSSPVHLWTNVIFALDQYLVTYCCDDGVCPNPIHARAWRAKNLRILTICL